MTKSASTRCNWLMYISLFTLTITHINFPAISVVHGNAPALILCGFFFVVNFDLVVKSRWNNYEVLYVCFMVLAILTTVITASDFDGLQNGIKGYIGVILVYCSFKLWFKNISPKRLISTIKALIFGYLFVNCGIGILEAIYIYIWKSSVIYSVLKALMYRDIDNYLLLGRVQFWAEPSFASLYFILILVPFLISAYHYKLFSKNKVSIIFLLSTLLIVLTLSSRVFVDLVMFFLLWYISKVIKGKNINSIILGIIIFVLFLIFGLFYDNIAVSLSTSDISAVRRVGEIMTNGIASSSDYSMSVRYELLRCAMEGFVQKPVSGWGVGNFVQALRENYNENNITAWISKQQMITKLSSQYETSYSFYTTSLCESGIVGIGFILCILGAMKKSIKKAVNYNSLWYWMVILYLLVQYEITSGYVIIMWLAIFSTHNEGKFFFNSIGDCKM